ncbi:MAG: Rab family GTPase [Thermoplasmata archaeon]
MLEAVPKPRMKMKICAVGEEAVGKTSLIHRYIADKYEDDYIRTIGTLISKKTIEMEGTKGEPAVVDAVIWDIMGRRGFMDLLRDAYFYRANGVFAVLDTTRKATLEALHGWLEGVSNAVGKLPIVILANKDDLKKEANVTKKDIKAFAQDWDATPFITSAKTGKNVGEAFEELIHAAYERGISARLISDETAKDEEPVPAPEYIGR